MYDFALFSPVLATLARQWISERPPARRCTHPAENKCWRKKKQFFFFFFFWRKQMKRIFFPSTKSKWTWNKQKFSVTWRDHFFLFNRIIKNIIPLKKNFFCLKFIEKGFFYVAYLFDFHENENTLHLIIYVDFGRGHEDSGWIVSKK